MVWGFVMRIEDINYGIVVIDTRIRDVGGEGIVHFCGYVSCPEACHYDELRHEISTHPQFGLCDSSQFLVYEPASPEILQFFKNLFLQ